MHITKLLRKHVCSFLKLICLSIKFNFEVPFIVFLLHKQLIILVENLDNMDTEENKNDY